MDLGSKNKSIKLTKLLNWKLIVGDLMLFFFFCLISLSKLYFFPFLLLFTFFFLNWRIIALQCCVGFCHTTTQISHDLMLFCMLCCSQTHIFLSVYYFKFYILPISLHFLKSQWPLKLAAAAAAKSLRSCPTLCDPIDVSPPGSPFPGILQARTLEWVAISFSNAWK